MADVFISYTRRNRETTITLANSFQMNGYSVWWDWQLLPHENFRKRIEQELTAAKAVVIIWTQDAINSEWVLSEATRARAQNKLVNVRDTSLSSSRLPMPFDVFHCATLEELPQILASVANLVGQNRKPAIGADGRLKVDALVCHNVQNGMFRPGNGKEEWLQDFIDGPEMIVVPGIDEEKPLCIGRDPVTQDNWAEAIANGAQIASIPASEPPQADTPVTRVSWTDAKKYAEWLGNETRRRYRLPTEREWQHVCDAGASSASLGTALLGRIRDGIAPERKEAGLREVQLCSPNGWGARGMLGNAWEWCADTEADRTRPDDARQFERGLRVAKGGCWMSPVSAISAQSREFFSARSGEPFVSFRIVREIE